MLPGCEVGARGWDSHWVLHCEGLVPHSRLGELLRGGAGSSEDLAACPRLLLIRDRYVGSDDARRLPLGAGELSAARPHLLSLRRQALTADVQPVRQISGAVKGSTL